MRRWLAGIALGTVATLALAGCSRPAGTDGDLVDDWAPMAAPTVFTPESKTCHPRLQEVGYLRAYAPVDCEQPHRVETLHVGTLTDAGGANPPAAGSAGMRAAFGECDREVRTALGGDWRTSRIGLTIVFPSPPAWTGGARWFRCDAHETRSLDDPIPEQRATSLSGSLAGSSPLRHGCFNASIQGDEVAEMVAVKCTTRHRAEFAGIWRAPESSYSAFLKNSERTHRACRSVIAKFAKLPDDGNLQYRVGTIVYHPGQDEWRSGNRGVQCFLWSKELTRSMKGAGTGALPIN
ncbi:hypothetical protein C1I95_10080 [Micromonospora craterilacus]|uniref:Septum formation-related domain-containing protein n=1 Tax=Micromonospora craterilacus TaxID=1655439 RepID=A0A2W2EV60_9ACTN|nr:septum formation family protein [Micromonospora craterilacus]PZG20215.1 hypothetical protein C1I95_10080 [Micromonospora craterilacus]